jgi:hypothetical protein
MQSLVLYLLACGPLMLVLGAWLKLYLSRKAQPLHVLATVSLGITTANAMLAASTFLYYEHVKTARFLPPWQDPETLILGNLIFLAPVSMFVGIVATGSGAPRWLVLMVLAASLPLLVIGFFAAVSV